MLMQSLESLWKFPGSLLIRPHSGLRWFFRRPIETRSTLCRTKKTRWRIALTCFHSDARLVTLGLWKVSSLLYHSDWCPTQQVTPYKKSGCNSRTADGNVHWMLTRDGSETVWCALQYNFSHVSTRPYNSLDKESYYIVGQAFALENTGTNRCFVVRGLRG